MLVLKVVQYFNDWIRCSITRKILTHGHFYYQDDQDPKIIIDAIYYARLKKEKKEREFDRSKFNNAESLRDYKQHCRDLERQWLEAHVLDMAVLGAGEQEETSEHN